VRHLALSPLPSDPFPKTSGCDSLIESVWIVLVQDGGDVNLGENALIPAEGGFFTSVSDRTDQFDFRSKMWR